MQHPTSLKRLDYFDQVQNNRQDKYLKLKDKIKILLSNLLKLHTINVLHLQVEFRFYVTSVNQKDDDLVKSQRHQLLEKFGYSERRVLKGTRVSNGLMSPESDCILHPVDFLRVHQKDNLLRHYLQLQITTCFTSCAPREAMK